MTQLERHLQHAHPGAFGQYCARPSGWPTPTRTATAHSKLCGSTVTVDLKLDGDRVVGLRPDREGVPAGPGGGLGRWAAISSAPARASCARSAAPCADAEGGRAAARGPLGRPGRAGAGQGRQGAGTPRRCWCSTPSRRRWPRPRPSTRAAAARRRPERCLQPRPSTGARLPRQIAKAPIHAYRWTLKPLIGWECRHLPTCSEYALEAIDRNGAWRGRLAGAVAHLPLPSLGNTTATIRVPDISGERHPLAPWRYGRWRGSGAPAPTYRARRPSAAAQPRQPLLGLGRAELAGALVPLAASARSGTTPCTCRRASSAGS